MNDLLTEFQRNVKYSIQNQESLLVFTEPGRGYINFTTNYLESSKLPYAYLNVSRMDEVDFQTKIESLSKKDKRWVIVLSGLDLSTNGNLNSMIQALFINHQVMGHHLNIHSIIGFTGSTKGIAGMFINKTIFPKNKTDLFSGV